MNTIAFVRAITSLNRSLPAVVENRDTYLLTVHLNHSVSQPELPRLVIAVMMCRVAGCRYPWAVLGAPIALPQTWFKMQTF
jgi:hypothetical protein